MLNFLQILIGIAAVKFPIAMALQDALKFVLVHSSSIRKDSPRQFVHNQPTLYFCHFQLVQGKKTMVSIKNVVELKGQFLSRVTRKKLTLMASSRSKSQHDTIRLSQILQTSEGRNLSFYNLEVSF